MTTLDPATWLHSVAFPGDERIHYVHNGPAEDRESVVLVHGWPQTWYSWRKVMPLLHDANYHVVAVDMRGSGDSSRPEDGYDSITVATEIHEVVESLGLKAVHLVGHDNGARVAYAYAALFENEVRDLNFLESKILGLADPEDVTNEYWHFGFHQSIDVPELLTAGNERAYLSWFYRRYSYDPMAISEPEVDEYVRCYSSLGGMRAGFAYYRAFPESGVQHRRLAKKKLTIPVLALGGSACMATIPIESMRLAADNVTGGVLEQCGHWMPDEQPAALTTRLVEHFKS